MGYWGAAMFQWNDYTNAYAQLVDSWLDEEAVAMTGISDGWDVYWSSVLEDAANYPGCADYCKVIFEDSVPIAAVCYGIYENTMTVSEFVVSPELRGMGKGTQLLTDLVEFVGKCGHDAVNRIEAVVYPQNIASQNVFRKAGFVQERKTEDGVDLIFSYPL
jgi:RimJ/RimL family protein N-acetyltransferase